jgi:hypothetical protein
MQILGDDCTKKMINTIDCGSILVILGKGCLMRPITSQTHWLLLFLVTGASSGNNTMASCSVLRNALGVR